LNIDPNFRPQSATAFFTVVHPGNMPFFSCFLDSLSRQSNQDFDLLLFNDDVPNHELAEQIQRHSGLNTLVVDVKGRIASIRKQGLEYLKQFPEYQNIIFGDSDDFFSDNLIDSSIAGLKNYDMLIRDLNIVDEQGKILIPHFWGERLNHGFEPDIGFLLDQNVMGLGNVAMRSSCLQFYAIDEDHAVVDWTLFCSMLLGQANLHIYFDSEVQTYYRQHADNIAGLTQCNPEKIEQARQVKIKHYAFLLKQIHIHHPQYAQIQQRLNLMQLAEHLIQDLDYLAALTKGRPFWWEIAKLKPGLLPE
jgi:hypothetical protein